VIHHLVIVLGYPPIELAFGASVFDSDVRGADEVHAIRLMRLFFWENWHCCAFCKGFAITEATRDEFSDQHFLLNQTNGLMSISIRHSITSGQCRAARALLDMTQPELAEAAGLGLSTIVDFEKSRRDVSRAAVHAMQKALERAGILFVAKNGGGPGVRLRN
jgi:DNA-binding XRE family transcriptional regulator